MAEILHRVGIAAKPDKVFAALTTVEGLRGWWTKQVDGSGVQGGDLDFGWVQMRVAEAVPRTLVLWNCARGDERWLGTELRFRLESTAEQTLVHFAHRGWRDATDFMSHCSTKWAIFLMSLKAYCESGKGRPLPDDVKIALDD